MYSEWSGFGYTQRFKVDKILHEVKSEHHHLVIFETPYFGRVLALDGVVQTTEKDEYAYHEMLAHVPILAHGTVNSVLIIGGGDGGEGPTRGAAAAAAAPSQGVMIIK